MFSIDDTINYYTLARHPRNRGIIDIKDKKSKELRYIKIRHRLANFYAISLVDPKTFDVCSETQVKSARDRVKPITVQGYKDSVNLKDTSLLGFEWSFEWENQKYKWVREGAMRRNMECRRINGNGNDISVAQYLPRGVKDEYFGLITVLGYNLTRCGVSDQKTMQLLLITSLMTILDKADDNGWKKEVSSGALFLDPNDVPSVHHPDEGDAFEHQIDDETLFNNNKHDSNVSHYSSLVRTASGNCKRKEQLQKEKSERNIEQRLQWMIEKDVRRSQKQIRRQTGSKQTSPLGSGVGSSPIPSPTTSTHDLRLHQQRQQLEYLGQMLSAMNHSGNSSATLPPTMPPSFETRPLHQLQSMWYDHNDELDDDIIPSRRYNSHHRSQSQNKSSVTVDQQGNVTNRLHTTITTTSSSTYHNSNNRYSVPVSYHYQSPT